MLLEVNDLRTYYFTYRGLVKAVDGVSFALKENETIGIAGESACGKTTLAMSIIRMIRPPGKIVGGNIFFHGKDILKMTNTEMSRIRGNKISMVYQSAMGALNPVFTIKDQIIEAILTHQKMSKVEAEKRAKELADMVRIDSSRLKEYPHEYSGGMKQRIIIAIALANNPDIVILDEPTTALDVVVQAQILGLINDLREKLGMSAIIISHDIPVINTICKKMVIMYAGKVMEYADISRLLKNPKNPYSMQLMNSFPKILSNKKKRLTSIPGFPPNLANPPEGCRFHPRCPYAMGICKKEEPEIIEVEKHHLVACHLYSLITAN